MIFSSMSCHFYTIDDFDEKQFCRFLSQNQPGFASFKNLTLKFDSWPVPNMKVKSICALIQHSNLETIENLFSFDINEEDFKTVAEAAKAKNLVLVQSVLSEKNRWIRCSAHFADHVYT